MHHFYEYLVLTGYLGKYRKYDDKSMGDACEMFILNSEDTCTNTSFHSLLSLYLFCHILKVFPINFLEYTIVCTCFQMIKPGQHERFKQVLNNGKLLILKLI